MVERFALHGEAAAGVMLGDFQRNALQYDFGFQGSARLAFTVIDPIAIQVTGSTWWLPSPLGAGQETLVGGGVRFEPRVGHIGRFFLDANIGAGFTGSYTKPMFDVGLGFEFDLIPGVALGPAIRYAQLFASDQACNAGNCIGWADAQSLSFGLALTLRPPPVHAAPPPPPPPPPRDTDHDGVLDPDDICPSVPAGEHPDPARMGCPLPDTDHDGVFDPDDHCPTEPAGDHPDPAQPGCPLRDTDFDGVFDPQDVCPNTAAGEHPDPDRPGCPDGDDDNDRVRNHEDQCRDVPAGIHPDPARPGCPLPDRDHDTVPDAVDHCPDQPGMPSPNPRRNGCPGLVDVHEGQIRIHRPVYFATNRERILPRSNAVLQAVADALRATPEIARVAVQGHTDNVGDPAYNQDLSQRRAASVVVWLVAHGISADRLEPRGYGQDRPVAPNTTRAGRAQNRRVEFHIIAPETLASPEDVQQNASTAPSAAPPASSAPPAANAAPAASAAPADHSSAAPRHDGHAPPPHHHHTNHSTQLQEQSHHGTTIGPHFSPNSSNAGGQQ